MDGRVDTLGESAPYGRIQFAYALMAQAAGVRMTECRMLERDGRAHFMTRRFDRADGAGCAARLPPRAQHLEGKRPMKIIDVTASRSHGWWAIHANVPGASVWTQARRLDQVEATAREAISLALDTAQDSFELSIAPVVPEGIRHEVELARNTARLAAIAQAIATTLNQHAAVSLTAEGYTVRDAGYLMNLSSQRISQLVAQQRNRAEESTEASTTFESVVESLLAQLLSAADGLSDTSSQTGEPRQREEHGPRRTPTEKQRTSGKKRATAKNGPLTASA